MFYSAVEQAVQKEDEKLFIFGNVSTTFFRLLELCNEGKCDSECFTL